MIIDIFGSILIIVSCYAIGKSVTLRNEYRIRDINNLLSAMKIFENEIRYNLSDIPTTIKKMHTHLNENNKQIFDDILKESTLSNGTALSEIWTNSVIKSSESLYYTKGDIKTLSEFGLILGSGNVDTQLKNIDSFIISLSEHLDNANNEFNSKGKIYSKLSVYAALVIIVLII